MTADSQEEPVAASKHSGHQQIRAERQLDQLTIEQLNPSPLTMVWIEDQEDEQQSTTQENDQASNSNQEVISSQEFQEELQRQEQIDEKGDRDFEAEIKQDITVPQRVTRSKNNIYKKNKKYDEDYVWIKKEANSELA